MNQNEMKWKSEEVREINLGDLLWKILYGWRLILVLAIIFAIGLCGLQYIRAQRTSVVPQQNEPLSLEEIKERLTEDEWQTIRKATALQQQIAEQRAYNDNALSMHITAYAKNVVMIQYYVNTEYAFNYTEEVTPDYVGVLVNSYIAYASNEDMEKLSEEQNLYVGEMVSATQLGAEQFMISVAGADAKQAEELADKVADLLEDYRAVLVDKIGSHKLVEVNRYSRVQRDEALAAKQIERENALVNLQTELDTLTSTFTSAQRHVFAGEEIVADTAQQVEKTASIDVKYLLLGALVGIFLACVWIAMCYILSGRIKSVQELGNIFGLRIFGSISLEKKKRAFSFVDRWLDKLRKKRQRTLEQQYELVLTNLKVTCRKAKIEQVFFTTSMEMTDADRRLLEELQKRLEKEGVKSSFGEDIVHNAGSLERMAEMEYVVLLEKTGTTDYADVEQELTLCVQQNAKVLGVVGVE